jgi:hypothetical protein
VRTAIVSNVWPHARVRLAANGVTDQADEIVRSCEAGVAKPDRRIFELALGRLGADPARPCSSTTPQTTSRRLRRSEWPGMSTPARA